jgi:hypothetical protein
MATGQSKMDNPEKLAIQSTQGEENQTKKHNTICVRHKAISFFIAKQL